PARAPRDPHSFPTRRSSDLGSAADLLKRTTVELHEQGVPVVLYVHDEIVAEVRVDEAEKVAHTLETALTREVNNISGLHAQAITDRKSTRLNSSHVKISYAV